jgi:hypothetical protein
MLPTDLPTTMPEFLARFGREESCREHLFSLRWPEGFRCKSCQGDTCYELESRTHVFQCQQCGTQNSLLAGTIFEQTKSPLQKWFLAFHLFLSSKGGISALELKRQLGFASDQTAWTWLHKIRRALDVRGKPLEDLVEVDETCIGGPKPGQPGRGAAGKTRVAGAVERRSREVVAPDPEGFSGIVRTLAQEVVERLAREGVIRVPCLGRARLGVIADASVKSLEEFVKSVVASGATVVGDAWSGLAGLAQAGYRHERINISKSDEETHQYLPASHLVFALLKRVLLGTYHGGIGARHLPAYLDEFVFRFNRRNLAPALRTCAALTRAVETPPYRNQEICGRTKTTT